MYQKPVFYQYEITKDGITEIMSFPKPIHYKTVIPFYKGQGFDKIFIKFLGYYSV